MVKKITYKRIIVLGFLFSFMFATILAGKGIFEESSQAHVYGEGAELKSYKGTRPMDEDEVAEIKESIEAGLEYLNETQHADGGWVDSYGKNTNMIGSCLRAFVDFNATDPRWQDAIEGAVRFLRFVWHDPADYNSQNDKDRWGGMLLNDKFHPTYTHGEMYQQGSACASLIDYYFHTRDISILPYINESVDMVVRAQNTPHKPASLGGPRSQGGWRYTPTHTSSDTSLSGWNMHAVILAESSGIYDVPDYTFEYSERWLDHCASGSGYGYSGAYTSYTNTAVGTYCMLLMGKGDKPSVQGALNSIRGWGPTYNINQFYYTYHASIAMYLVGGQEWQDWYAEVSDALMSSQNADGSWNGEYGMVWGTAMAINTLNLGINKPNDVVVEPQKDPNTGEEDDMVKMVQPEHTVTYNITVGSALGFVENPLSQAYEEADKIELSITDPLPGWSAELDTPSNDDDGLEQPDGSKLWWVELKMHETDNVTLSVTAPPLGKVSEPCVVSVIARLTNEYGVTQDKLATVSILDIEVDFDLEFLADKDEFTGYKIGEIAPGERKIYHAELHNMGNVNDTYDVTLSYPSNWKVMFDDGTDKYNTSLGKKGAADSVIINITVEAPITASKGERVDITITAISQMYNSLGLGTLRRSDNLLLTVTGLPAIVVVCEDDSKHIDPGSIVEYELIITNNYESSLDVIFSFTGAGDIVNSLQIFDEKWSAGFQTNNFEIMSRDIKKIKFQIAAPNHAVAGIRKVIEIRATGYDNFGMEFPASSISVTGISNLVSKLSGSVVPPSLNCDPGKEVDYQVNIVNEGNGDEIVDLAIVDLPLGWDYQFINSSMVLGPYMNGSTWVTIQVPSNAMWDANPETPGQDPYKIGINYSSREKILGYGDTKYVDLYVNKKANFMVISDIVEKDAPPRSECDFIFEVKNIGNAIDDVKLNISFADILDWNIYFPFISLNRKIESLTKLEPINFNGTINLINGDVNVLYVPSTSDLASINDLNIRMDVGDSLYIGVRVEVPEEKKEGYFDFSIKALRDGDVYPADNVENFKITIIMPDLRLDNATGIAHTPLEVGKVASFTAKVRNTGVLTAEDISVSLYVDNKEVDTRLLPRLSGTKEKEDGGVKIVTFVWPVTSGKHEIRIAIDPDNEIVEESEGNNIIEKNINVKESTWAERLGINEESTPWIVFFIILAGMTAAGTVYAVNHFKK